MNESTPFDHHPYKPKQHFTHYNKFRNIQTACHNHIQPTDQNLSRTTSKKISQQKQSSDHETITALAKIRNKKFPSSTIVNIPCLVCGDRSSGVRITDQRSKEKFPKAKRSKKKCRRVKLRKTESSKKKCRKIKFRIIKYRKSKISKYNR
jgi:hypothetical protein